MKYDCLNPVVVCYPYNGYTHYGMLYDDLYTGARMYIESLYNGVRRITENQYREEMSMHGWKYTVFDMTSTFSASKLSEEQVYRNIRDAIEGSDMYEYNVVTNNCEGFVYRLFGSGYIGTQSIGVLTASAVALAIYAKSK